MGVVITHKQMEFWKRNITAVVGMLIFSMGINFFIVPADLYNGGVLGVSQIIRTFLVRYLHLFSGSTDIAGVINMLLNVPLFILAYFSISKNFFARTLVCVVSQTLFLSVVPIPAKPIVADGTFSEYHRWYIWWCRYRYCFEVRWFKRWNGYCRNVLYKEV